MPWSGWITSAPTYWNAGASSPVPPWGWLASAVGPGHDEDPATNTPSLGVDDLLDVRAGTGITSNLVIGGTPAPPAYVLNETTASLTATSKHQPSSLTPNRSSWSVSEGVTGPVGATVRRWQAALAAFGVLVTADTTIRDPFPAEMLPLNYGTDYVEIPGTTDQYVQYDESVACTFQGWRDLTTTATVDTGSGAGITAQVMVGAWSDDPSGGADGVFSVGWPTMGTPAVSGTGSLVVPLSSYADPAIQVVFTNDWWTSRADEADNVFAAVDYSAANISFYLQMPPWRYWIPGGVPPLRQRQRDDGATGWSVYRSARGTSSRQQGLRQRGYL